MAGLTKGKSNRSRKLSKKYDDHFAITEKHKKVQAEARKRKALSPGALRRKAERTIKALTRYGQNLDRYPERLKIKREREAARVG